MTEELDSLRAIIEADDQPVFALDTDLRYTAFNQAHAAAMRELYRVEIALGGRLADYQTVKADRETAHANLERALAGERVVANAFSGEPGRGRFFDVVHAPQTDAAGTVVGVVVRAYDVSKTKAAEEEVRTILRTTIDGYYLVDKDGRFLDTNDSYCQMIGHSREKLLEMAVKDIEAIDTEEVIKKRIQRIMETGHDRFETRHRCKDGRVIDIEASVNLLSGDQGKLVVFMRDITKRKAAEAALRESEQRLSLATEAAGLGVFDVDVSTGAHRWDPRTRELWGVGPGEPISSDIVLASVHPDDREGLRAAMDRQLDPHADPSFVDEYRVINRVDGVEHWVSVFGTTLFEDDRPVRTVGFVQDITERKQVEQTLQQSEGLLRGLFDNMPSGAAIYEVRGDGSRGNDYIVKGFNATSLRIEGKTRDEVVGKSLLDLRPTIDQYGLIPVFQRVWQTGEPALFPTTRYTDASYANWYENRVFRLPSGEIVAVYDDVTESRQAEEALKENRALLRAIIEGTTDAIYVKDLEGRYLLFNAAAERVTGKRAADVLGKDDGFLFPPDEARVVMEGDRKAMESGSTATYEETVTDAAGRLSTFLSTKGPVYDDDDGELLGLFGIARDITERKQAEEEIGHLNAELETRVVSRSAQLEAVNKELEAFAYSVSHDVRGPLRSIDGFSAMVLEDQGDQLTPESVERLQRAGGAAQRMARLLDDLLGLSRISRRDLLHSRVDLSELARELATELRAEHPARRVDLSIAAKMSADADPALARIILRNLLSNAWKFTSKHETARIKVGVTDEGGERAFFVRDDGAGFDERYAAHLFGAFQRMHSADEFEGNGIGLATVQRLVNRHGGRVWAEAEVEKGATFYFTLPEPPAII